MSDAASNPRSDFERRLTNFDRAADAGMWAANPGILLGLNPDLAYELLALLRHVRHLRGRGRDLVPVRADRQADEADDPARPVRGVPAPGGVY